MLELCYSEDPVLYSFLFIRYGMIFTCEFGTSHYGHGGLLNLIGLDSQRTSREALVLADEELVGVDVLQ